MYRLARFSKALAALSGSVVALLVAFGVDLTPEQTAALTGVLSTLAVILAPANAPPPDQLSWHHDEHGNPVRD